MTPPFHCRTSIGARSKAAPCLSLRRDFAGRAMSQVALEKISCWGGQWHRRNCITSGNLAWLAPERHVPSATGTIVEPAVQCGFMLTCRRSVERICATSKSLCHNVSLKFLVNQKFSCAIASSWSAVLKRVGVYWQPDPFIFTCFK